MSISRALANRSGEPVGGFLRVSIIYNCLNSVFLPSVSCLGVYHYFQSVIIGFSNDILGFFFFFSVSCVGARLLDLI